MRELGSYMSVSRYQLVASKALQQQQQHIELSNCYTASIVRSRLLTCSQQAWHMLYALYLPVMGSPIRHSPCWGQRIRCGRSHCFLGRCVPQVRAGACKRHA